jgi:hypothetical protein
MRKDRLQASIEELEQLQQEIDRQKRIKKNLVSEVDALLKPHRDALDAEYKQKTESALKNIENRETAAVEQERKNVVTFKKIIAREAALDNGEIEARKMNESISHKQAIIDEESQKLVKRADDIASEFVRNEQKLHEIDLENKSERERLRVLDMRIDSRNIELVALIAGAKKNKALIDESLNKIQAAKKAERSANKKIEELKKLNSILARVRTIEEREARVLANEKAISKASAALKIREDSLRVLRSEVEKKKYEILAEQKRLKSIQTGGNYA